MIITAVPEKSPSPVQNGWQRRAHGETTAYSTFSDSKKTHQTSMQRFSPAPPTSGAGVTSFCLCPRVWKGTKQSQYTLECPPPSPAEQVLRGATLIQAMSWPSQGLCHCQLQYCPRAKFLLFTPTSAESSPGGWPSFTHYPSGANSQD